MYSLAAKRVGNAMVMRSQLVAVPAMRFAGNTKPLNDKEKGDERIFFTKEEGKRITNVLPIV